MYVGHHYSNAHLVAVELSVVQDSVCGYDLASKHFLVDISISCSNGAPVTVELFTGRVINLHLLIRCLAEKPFSVWVVCTLLLQ